MIIQRAAYGRLVTPHFIISFVTFLAAQFAQKLLGHNAAEDG